MAKTGKILGWSITLLVLAALAGFCYFKFLWVFSDGTKTGELNSLTSKTFKFSVADKEVAQKLSEMTGLRVTVHYKEYKGCLPWRGYERAIVDKVNEDTSYTRIPDEDPFFL